MEDLVNKEITALGKLMPERHSESVRKRVKLLLKRMRSGGGGGGGGA